MIKSSLHPDYIFYRSSSRRKSSTCFYDLFSESAIHDEVVNHVWCMAWNTESSAEGVLHAEGHCFRWLRSIEADGLIADDTQTQVQLDVRVHIKSGVRS